MASRGTLGMRAEQRAIAESEAAPAHRPVIVKEIGRLACRLRVCDRCHWVGFDPACPRVHDWPTCPYCGERL